MNDELLVEENEIKEISTNSVVYVPYTGNWTGIYK